MNTEDARIKVEEVAIPCTKMLLPTAESKNSMLSIAVTPWKNLRGIKIELECHSLFGWAHLKRKLSVKLSDDRWWRYRMNLRAVRYMVEGMQFHGCKTIEDTEFWTSNLSAHLKVIGILI